MSPSFALIFIFVTDRNIRAPPHPKHEILFSICQSTKYRFEDESIFELISPPPMEFINENCSIVSDDIEFHLFDIQPRPVDSNVEISSKFSFQHRMFAVLFAKCPNVVTRKQKKDNSNNHSGGD